ncbi:hypothetical protein TELCIR_04907 [Teladorsagia circumcincta]|uniref:Uncharacterized protein n=1 Tax=Teladorsagia circumcincta TaxID=45464 RepID=A0A2G9USA9_TELCI|nr:hypothetical protein TELCIR_04907 [Teladorsagia circumcincta]
MADGDVPQQYWNNLLALTTKVSAESEEHDVTPRSMSDEELADHLEDILGYAEITNRFVGKGGLLVIEAFLTQRQHLFLQCRFAEFVLSLTENNPSTQSLFAREGLLTKMMKLLEDDTYSEEFLFKLLSSVSGSVRSHLESFEEYILDFVDVKDIPPEILEDILACLKSRKIKLSIREGLQKKLNPE